jgi:hypothetical protein
LLVLPKESVLGFLRELVFKIFFLQIIKKQKGLKAGTYGNLTTIPFNKTTSVFFLL